VNNLHKSYAVKLSQPKTTELISSHLYKVTNNRKFRVISKRNDELVHHQSKNSELRSTAVVELNGTLLELLFLTEGVPAEVNVSIAEVTNELVSSSWHRLHERALKDSNERDDLHKSSGWDGVRAEKGSNTVRVRVERVTRVVDVSWEVDSSTGHDLAKESKHGNTAMLDLNVSKAFEASLVLTRQLAEGIEETKRRLDTELFLEGHVDGDRGLGLGSRSEGSSRGNDGSEDNELHFCRVVKMFSNLKL
jgi:hypothetical protein